MSHPTISTISTIFAALALAAGGAGAADTPVAPVAAKAAWQETRHGEVVTDDYRWLQKKENADVIAHLNAENAYTDAMTAAIAPLSNKLYAEIKGRMQEIDLSVPTRRGDYYYYNRLEAGKQYQIICRRPAGAKMAYDPAAPEEILLDQNKMAEGHQYFAVGSVLVSPDGRLLAYATDTTGFRQYTLFVKDLKSGQLLPDSAPRVQSAAWAADNQTLFFVQEDATTKRGDRLLRMKLGSAPVQVYHEPVEQFALQVAATRDKQFIRLDIGATDTSEVRLLPAGQPQGEFVSLGREKGHRYRVDHRDGELFITTNKDAKNFRVVTAPASAPQQQNWKPLLRHDGKVLVQNVEAFRDYLVVSEKTHALNRMRIYDFGKKTWKSVKFDDPVYLARGAGTPEFSAGAYRVSYQSPVTPPTVLDVDMATGARTVLKREEVVGGHDPKRYVTRRMWVTARDGVKVPLWAVYRKGTRFDGKAPLLLYSYGSYGYSTEATFASKRISLLERGVIYVQAHIRGGTDMGEHWHEDGMLMKKKNTFNDFIDSAEFLVKNKWTSPDRLIIEGGSAGGLLMGAVVNMRPDLFRAVHAAVPFVDVMNTMMDASLPLTTGEYLEWGDPNQKAAYDYMRSYSPYDNIERKKYPAMLVTTGLNDSQVMYWEPAKYVAKLRAHKTDSNPLLLKTNMGAGHGGASGRYDAIREGAFQMAWMLSQWGIVE
ncbi:oligopeptidase B [Massilia eurypsychrophila]|uniref:Oligopeptidase B n=1 Tax=Massilia eurypsychrophila TaxID=1485217 RepID=A0A2G8TKU3_9BURK|nr:S9 family peptidase [Massilia eurypsychrophila]PIL46667.1 oligopeptidase B [Massilia eurypsychrophila]